MPVVGNLSVLLTANITNYRQGMGIARKENELLGRSAAQLGTQSRQVGVALSEIRKEVFASLPLEQQLNQELKARQALFEAGALDFDEYQRSVAAVNSRYKELAANTKVARAEQRQLAKDVQAANAANQAALSPLERYGRRVAEINALFNNRDSGLTRGGREVLITQAFDQFSTATGESTQAQELAAQTKATNEFNQSAVRGTAILRRNSSQLAQIKDRVRDVKNAYAAGNVSLGRANQFIRIQRAEYRRLNAGLRTNAELESAAARAVESSLTPLQRRNRQLREIVLLRRRGLITDRQAIANIKRLNREYAQQATLIGRIVGQLGVLKTVGIGLTGALAFNAIFELGRAPVEFETQITKTLAVFKNASGATRDELEELRASALLAAELPTNNFNETQIGEALDKLARDNINARVAIETLPTVLSFATAAQTDFAAAVDLSSEVLKSFRLGSENSNLQIQRSTALMDTLANASLRSSSDVTELSQALIKAAPGARELDISLQETLATILALSETGRKGFAAGNEFRIAFRDLAKAFREQRALFDEFNIEVFDDDGQFVGTAQAIRTLTNALDDLAPEDATNLIKALGFADKGAQFQLQLLGLADSIDKFDEQLSQSNGFASLLAEDSIKETTKLLRGLRGVLVTFGSNFVIRPIELAAEKTNDLLDSINRFATGVEKRINSVSASLTELTKSIIDLDGIGNRLDELFPENIRNRAGAFITDAIANQTRRQLVGPFGELFNPISIREQQIDELSRFNDELDKVENRGTIQIDIDLPKELDALRSNLETPLEQFQNRLTALSQLQERSQTDLANRQRQVLQNNLNSLFNPDNFQVFPIEEQLGDQTKIREITAALEEYRSSLQAVDDIRLNTAADVLGSASDFSSVVSVRAEDPGNPLVRLIDSNIKNGANLQQILNLIAQFVDENRAREDEPFDLDEI